MWLVRRCPGCGEPARLVCGRCRERLMAWGSGPAPPAGVGLDGFTALVAYDEAASRLVLAAKNRGRRDLLAAFGLALGAEVAAAASAGVSAGPGVQAVTWVPASRSRRRRRGYDQGRVLARAAARELGVPAVALLARPAGEAQAGRNRAERLAGPGLRAIRASPRSVLVVDDVATTGASLARAAGALRQAGAVWVRAGVVAVA